MLIRAIALLVLVAGGSIALSLLFGAEVLAALGLLIAQIKIIFGKIFSLSLTGLMPWLKAQGLNFARVELAKRWFMKSFLPLLLGAATQRRIATLMAEFKTRASARYAAMMDWYYGLPRPVQIIAVLIILFATLALAVTSISLWLLLFSIQLPLWIIAGLVALWNMTWLSVQKMAFRTVAFMKLYRVWGALRARIPESYLARKRRFDFRVARMVVRQRKMTLAQLEQGKTSLALRWALIRAYFSVERPAVPSEAEYKAARVTREAKRSDPPGA